MKFLINVNSLPRSDSVLAIFVHYTLHGAIQLGNPSQLNESEKSKMVYEYLHFMSIINDY